MVDAEKLAMEQSAEAAVTSDMPMTNGTENGHAENHMSNGDAGVGSGNESSSGHKEKSHHSSSSSKHHSSSSSKDKDKHRSSSSHKHSSSSSSHKHHSSKDKSSSSSSRDKHHSSSSSSKDKHGSSSSSKHHSSSSSSSKDKHHSSSKHGSSSSSSKDKHSSSSSSKHGSSSSSSRDKDRSSSKHSSSSSKDRHRDGHSSSSSKKDGHHSSSSSSRKDGHHSSSSSSKHKESSLKMSPDYNSTNESSEPVGMTVKSETVSPPGSPYQVKQEPPTPVKEETMSPRYEMSPLQDASPPPVKMEDSDDDVPLSSRKPVKVEKRAAEESSDDEPLSARKGKKVKIEASSPKKRKMEDEDYDEYSEAPKKKKKKKVKGEKAVKKEQVKESPTKKASKAAAEVGEKWKWWEEERVDDGTKWKFLEHKGPMFAPPYEPLPSSVKFFYDGKEMKLSLEAEEVATFYGRMLDHDYTTKESFNTNFFKDWRKVMTSHERDVIKDLSKCNFSQILTHFKDQSEIRKNAPKAEKQKIKEQNAAIQEEYGWCTMDSHKEKIGNFRIEPPGLFRGRGTHPKMGKLKKRTMPEDVIINCAKGAKVPDPPEGHRWKEVRHDNTVSWLACWTENVQNQTKYVMLNPASKLKGEKDWQKYETARKLHKCVDTIRANYQSDWKSKEMKIRQRAVALYFIDKLALRAGNEKDEDTADTVGCCSLRYEHITLNEELDGKQYVVEFDFLGKDSIRYYNKVAVEKRVFKNLELFKQNKNEGDDLFDRLNTTIMNKHLNSLMEGLTAKVFRTYNASKTLQEQLDLLTNPEDPLAAKMLSYNRANRAVAILCNHQRAAPKNFSVQMENMQKKIDAKKDAIKAAKKDVKDCKIDYKQTKTEKARKILERKKKTVERLEEQLTKLEVAATDKDENKEIALGTSKLNYLDPRISVAWCKKWDVPIEKIYNKTQRDKFAWAIDMTEEEYRF